MELQNKKSPDEIDLIGLLSRLTKTLANNIKTYAGILFRNIILLISIFVIIAIIGFSLRYFLPHYFKTRAIYVSHYMPANMYGLLLDDLSNLASNGDNTGVLAEALKVATKSAAAIHAIQTEPLNSQDFQYKNDTTTVSVFRINLVLKDISMLEEIQKGIKDYLENNEYSMKRKDAKRKTLELIKADLVQKKKSLDSLQEITNKPNSPRVSGQVIVLAQPFMPMEMYKIRQDYNSRQFQVEQELSMIENIEIIQPFFKLNAPNTPDYNRIFLISIFLALILSLTLTPLLGTK